jgi:uncharacterized protein YbjT (DUF2867 family)
MTNTPILILGGTGKTGRRVAEHLRALDAHPRTAARHDADVHFDWASARTYAAALHSVSSVYLVIEGIGTEHERSIVEFLDAAQAAGVQHVTYLSARGIEQAPPSIPLRAVELALTERTGLTHTVLRPNWFMQDFSESFLQARIVSDDAVFAPSADGAEAFVDAEDIAAVAAATLLDPPAHAGLSYTLSGPEALTFAQIAIHISAATGRTITHVDPPMDQWATESVASGMAQDYAELHIGLFQELRAGHGAHTTDDVRRVTGDAPTRFAAYAARHETLAAWTGEGLSR